MRPEDVPDWAAWTFGTGAAILAASLLATIVSSFDAHLGVVVGLLLLAIGQHGAEKHMRRK